MTDVELDARVTALEENGGGGNSLNGKMNVFFLQHDATSLHLSFIICLILLIEQFNNGTSRICHMGAPALKGVSYLLKILSRLYEH